MLFVKTFLIAATLASFLAAAPVAILQGSLQALPTFDSNWPGHQYIINTSAPLNLAPGTPGVRLTGKVSDIQFADYSYLQIGVVGRARADNLEPAIAGGAPSAVYLNQSAQFQMSSGIGTTLSARPLDTNMLPIVPGSSFAMDLPFTSFEGYNFILDIAPNEFGPGGMITLKIGDNERSVSYGIDQWDYSVLGDSAQVVEFSSEADYGYGPNLQVPGPNGLYRSQAYLIAQIVTYRTEPLARVGSIYVEAHYLGGPTGPNLPPAEIPEPSGTLLFASGMFCLIMGGWRRKRVRCERVR